MKFLDLCAGIGGFSLGLERAGMTCAGQVEIDPFCLRVLEKHWPTVPRWKDVKDESILEQLPAVDLVCGGYPCQPFSVAGKRRGADDDRHLWPYVLGIVQRLRPAWCLFENVAGHVTMGLDVVLSDLEEAGYACRPLVVPAVAIGAPHRRDRLWILAHTSRTGFAEPRIHPSPQYSEVQGEREGIEPFAIHGWPAESGLVRVVHGVPHRVDRVKALGNAVVPDVVEVIGLAIRQAHKQFFG